MLNSITHGTTGLVLAYGLAALGLLLAFRRDLAAGRIVGILIFALPVTLGVLIAWAVLQQILFRSWSDGATTVLGTVFMVGASFGAGVIKGRLKTNVTHKRGTVVSDSDTNLRRSATRDGELSVASLPVSREDESKHFKMIGTTGTGKSTAIFELMGAALARGDRAVIADPDGSYLRCYYDEDEARGDVILNPFDTRASRWDLFGEVTQLHDADQLARSLIPDYEGGDRSWRGYARTFLSAVLRQLHRAGEQDLAKVHGYSH
jgi:hypothetical protein